MKTYEIKSLSDAQLIERAECLVRRERELVECLILHLQEIQDRKLFIAMGYSSLFECLVKHFKYSESIAYSRLSVLKIIKSMPEVTEALQSGDLNITHITLAQSYFRQQEKETRVQIPVEDKRALLSSLMKTSTKEAKQILAEINPVGELPKDQVRYLDKEYVQILITEKKDILELMERIKELVSHEYIDPSFGEILRLSFKTTIETLEKKKGIHFKKKDAAKDIQSEMARKAAVSKSKSVMKTKSELKSATQSFADRNSRYISRRVKQAVLKRAQNQCEYVHKNGERCASRFQTQFDHITAFSRGGSSELANMQLLCRVHNAFKGNREFQ